MQQRDFRKLSSRILRHSGFTVKVNRDTGEYELFNNSAPDPVLYCKLITIESETDKAEMENYLCFRVFKPLEAADEKIYQRMINRFTRLAPSISISLENEQEPIFTDSEYEILAQIIDEQGDTDEK